MGWFSLKPKTVKEIYGGAWGHLVNDHGLTVEMLTENIRCVEMADVRNGIKVKMLRVFSLRDAEQQGITIAGWDTFDQHPELILFEGYLDDNNAALLIRKNY
jgi:hypothetical protein